MPVLTQLNLNVGTEQKPNMVLHDLHDIRISSTDVNTVTRILGCDAGVNSIAPLTLASAASLLGVGRYALTPNGLLSTSANNITTNGVWYSYGGSSSYDLPNVYGILITIMSTTTLTYGYTGVQLFINPSGGFWFRTRGASGWGATWYELQVKTTE